MIKIKKRIIKEAETATVQGIQTTQSQDTATEKTVDDMLKAAKLNKFSELSNTAQTNTALTTDFKALTGDQKYTSLAEFLKSLGIDKATVQSTLGKM